MNATISEQLATIIVDYKDKADNFSNEVKMFKSLLDACPLPMFLTNKVGSMLYVNQAYLLLLGARLEDIVGNGWLNFIHNEDRQKVLNYWEKIVAKRLDRFDGTCRYVRMDGGIITASIRICRIYNDNYSGFILQVNPIA